MNYRAFVLAAKKWAMRKAYETVREFDAGLPKWLAALMFSLIPVAFWTLFQLLDQQKVGPFETTVKPAIENANKQLK